MGRTYYYNIDGKLVPDEESMAAYLIDEGVLFVNSRDYKDKMSSGHTLVLFININDVFGPGADAEDVTYEELPKVYDLYQEKGYQGIIEFVGQKRGYEKSRYMEREKSND